MCSLQVESETPDMWLGLLREPRPPGSPLGRTFFGPQGLWWKKDATMKSLTAPFAAEIEATTLAGIITAHTGATVSGNAFAA
jgi:hypothetical protein